MTSNWKKLTIGERRRLIKEYRESSLEGGYPDTEQRRNVNPACWNWELPDPFVVPLDAREGWRLLRQWHGRDWCGICGDGSHSPLVVDHDHYSGLIRGYLCRSCNAREGRDNFPRSVYARWRAIPSTLILGLRFYHHRGVESDRWKIKYVPVDLPDYLKILAEDVDFTLPLPVDVSPSPVAWDKLNKILDEVFKTNG